MRALRGLIISLGFTLTAAAPAIATVRYASPGGTDTVGPCTNAGAPCTIVHAFNDVMTNGDELVLAPGDYAVSTPLSNASNNVSVHAQPGHRARIVGDTGNYSTAVKLLGNGASLRDVEAVNTDPTVGNGIYINEGTVERSIGRAVAGSGCSTNDGGTFIDSVCEGQTGIFGFDSASGPVTSHVTLLNVTAIGTAGNGIDFESGDDFTFNVDVFGTIARGTQRDVYAANSGSSGTTITLGYSNYATSDTSGSNSSIVQSPMGSNQAAAPVFVNPAAGDFREAATSPTIDHGVNNPNSGTLDLDGNPRVLGAREDIGAYEFTPPSTTASLSTLTLSSHKLSIAGRMVKGQCVKPTSKNRHAKRCKRPVQLVGSYTLSAAAAVTFTITRQTQGRRVHGKCVVQTKKNRRHNKKCTLSKVALTTTSTGKAGPNSFTLTAKSLGAGSYTLTATTAGGSGQSTGFKITG